MSAARVGDAGNGSPLRAAYGPLPLHTISRRPFGTAEGAAPLPCGEKAIRQVVDLQIERSIERARVMRQSLDERAAKETTSEGLRFYQDRHTGMLAALVMTRAGTPKQESHLEVHRGRPCHILYAAVGGEGYVEISRCLSPRLPSPREYRAVTKEEAREIDQNTEYSMYGVFAAASGTSLRGRFFEEMGSEGTHWYEVPHVALPPSLVPHADIAALLADQDFYHVRCAVKAFGVEVVNKIIVIQRRHSLREIVETNRLYEEAPKLGANPVAVIWKGEQEGPELCGGCQRVIRVERREGW